LPLQGLDRVPRVVVRFPLLTQPLLNDACNLQLR
jgi:hypothetical protein